MKTNKGISIFATVLIIALVAVGGITLVQVSKNAETRIDLEETHDHEEQEAVKKQAQNALLQLKAAMNLETDAEAAIQVIENIKIDMVTAYADAHENEQAELLEIIAQLDEISLALQNRSEEAFTAIDNTLLKIDTYLPTELQLGDALLEVNTETETETTETDTTETTETETTEESTLEVDSTTSGEIELQ